MQPEIALPYRTDWRDLASLLDYCKGKGSDRSALEARFGAGESLREALNALEQLGLIARGDAGDVRLSLLGEQLAYAPDAARQRERLTEALYSYPPYRYPLERAVADELRLLDAPWVEHIWQVDMRLGQPRNRVEEARTFFFRLADEAGLGVYRRGVRGQTTRLELAGNVAEQLARAEAALERARQSAAPTSAARSGAPASAASRRVFDAARDASVERSATSGAAAPTWERSGAPPRAAAAPSAWTPASQPPPAAPPPPTDAWLADQPGDAETQFAATLSGAPIVFNVRVDMTDWDIEKIAAFLRLVREQGTGGNR